MNEQSDMFGPDTLTLAKSKLFSDMESGEMFDCPCCGQLCKIYKRKLNSAMAAALCWLVKKWLSTHDYIHVNREAPRYVIASNETSRAAWWNLVEPKASEIPEQKASGLWKPTQKGVDFVEERIRVPRHIFIFNNKLLRFSEENTSIREALGDKFNYDELMAPF